MGGEVEGSVHGEHAAGSVGGALAGGGFDRRHELHAVAERRGHLRREQARFAGGVPARFAHLAGDQHGQLPDVLRSDLREAFQHGGALGQTRIAPGRKRLPGASDGVLDGARVRDREATDHIAGIRGGDALEEVAHRQR